MKYKLLGENNFLFDFLGIIAKNRGVEDIENLTKVTVKDTYDWQMLDNIKEASTMVKKHLDKNSKIHIIQDCDADGVTSATIVYQFLKKVKPNINITVSFHNKKIHGIFEEEMQEINYDFDLLIVPDAGTNDFEMQRKICAMGKDIVILDHHNAELEETPAIIVNVKTCNYPNKELCGAGVVYKFCQAMDSICHTAYADYFLDLVALGMIADMMDSRVLESRYLMSTGLKKINNIFFKELIEKNSFRMGKLNMVGVSWYIAPLINAVQRVGTLEQKRDLFIAFTGEGKEVPYKKRGQDKAYLIPFEQNMAREINNIKKTQDTIRDRSVDAISNFIENNPNVQDYKILFINVTDVEDADFLGLIANNLAGEYQRPVVLLKENDDGILRGSGRNYDKSGLLNLQQFLLDSKLCEYAEGHENALGVGVKFENIKTLIDYCNENAPNDPLEETYFVDFIFKASDITRDLVKKFDNLIDLYGTEFKEPQIVINDVEANEIFVNDKKTMLGFTSDKGVKYVKFFPTEEDIATLQGTNAKLNIVGRARMNEYQGEVNPQIIIDNYEFLCYNDKKKEMWF